MPQTYAFAPSRYTSICSFVKAWDAKEVGLCAAHGENHRSSFIGSECNHFELSSLVRFTRRGGGRPQLTSRIWAPPSPRREDGGARGEGGAYPPPPPPPPPSRRQAGRIGERGPSPMSGRVFRSVRRSGSVSFECGRWFGPVRFFPCYLTFT